MNKITTLTKVASAVILTLSISACSRFDDRAQATGPFDYEESTLVETYKSDQFSKEEQRSTYNIQALTKEQKALGLMGEYVDIRPPTQLVAVLDGVLLDPSQKQVKIWFNAFSQEQKMERKVWNLVLKYLAEKKSKPIVANFSTLKIETAPVITEKVFGGYLNHNYIHDEATYDLQLGKSIVNRSVFLTVNVKNYKQINDDVALELILAGRTKRNIEIDFVNDLLEFAYQQQESKALNTLDSQLMQIKLGFDDNHQTSWIIDNEFVDVWRKLPPLLNNMGFEAVQEDRNLGYFLVKFAPKSKEYWIEKSLNPINLEAGEYFVQLGELTGGETSITWLDADKIPLTDQQISDLYLSTSENTGNIILENEIAANPL